MKLNLIVSALVSKAVKFLHCLGFFTSFGSIGNIKDLREAKSTSSTYNGSDIILLADVM